MQIYHFFISLVLFDFLNSSCTVFSSQIHHVVTLKVLDLANWSFSLKEERKKDTANYYKVTTFLILLIKCFLNLYYLEIVVLKHCWFCCSALTHFSIWNMVAFGKKLRESQIQEWKEYIYIYIHTTFMFFCFDICSKVRKCFALIQVTHALTFFLL